MPIARTRRARAIRLVAAGFLLCATLPSPVRAQPGERPFRLMDDPGFIRLKRDLIWREYRLELRERAGRARERRASRRRRRPYAGPGHKIQPLPPDEDVRSGRRPPESALATRRATVQSALSNAIVNSRTFDGYGAVQAEKSVAMVGAFGLAAWNDGQGFYNYRDSQWCAWTANGGASWNPSAIPHPAGAPTWYWFSDPSVTVNEKSGEYYYCGLTMPSSSTNGIGIARGHFAAGSFVWDAVVPVRSGSNSSIFFDKQWIVADSSSGNLYLSYTVFGTNGDSIVFQRSTDGGAHWDNPLVLNQTGAGYVSGSRPAVGPNGELLVVWQEEGATTSYDWMRCRYSTTHGASFGAQGTVATEFSNIGSGAPGFNRERGITFPSIAVDRSPGAQRGRMQVVWNESLNYLDDPLNTLGSQAEVEPDDFFSRATPFTPGQRLTGSLARPDADLWSFAATQGTTYIFYLQPQVSRLNYTLRVYCGADTVTRLGYSGDPDSTQGTGRNGLIVWTAPTTATYFVRVAQTGWTGSYVLSTGVAVHGSEPGRDQRDAIGAWSDNGTSWSAPARINDDSPWFDNWLPEVGVSREGYVYASWYDWRDALSNCGGSSNLCTTRSLDGGSSWAPAAAVSDSATRWTFQPGNIAPNQGDYIGLSCSDGAAYLWADGRRGDPDVYSGHLWLLGTLTGSPDSAWAPGSTHDLATVVHQPNVLFANAYTWTVTSQRNWPGFPITGTTAPLPASATTLHIPVSVPDTAAGVGENLLCVRLGQANGVRLDSTCTHIAVSTVSGVAAAARAVLELRGAWPNPASTRLTIDFTLASGAPASLELIDVAGRRVVAREVGGLGPGRHALDVSREAAGLRPGGYSIRLVQGGQALARRLVLVR